MVAAAFDQSGHAGTAERAERRIDREPARPSGELRRPFIVVALAARTLQIGSRPRHGGTVGGGVAHECEPAVVGHIEPFVRVGGPGVRRGDTVEQVAEARARPGPEAERPVDVHPGVSVRARQTGDLAERIERAGVHVAGLRADDRGRARGVPECVAQGVGKHATLAVGLHFDHAGIAQAEQPERAVDGDVRFVAGDDGDARRADEPLRADVPSGARQHRLPGRGKTSGIGHLPTGDESHARALGKPEQFTQPSEDGLLDDRGGGREHEQPRVLVPGARQPVGRQRCRHAASDDETEEPRTPAGDDAWVGLPRELFHDARGGFTLLGQRACQRIAHGRCIGGGADWPRSEALQVAGCGRVRCIESCAIHCVPPLSNSALF